MTLKKCTVTQDEMAEYAEWYAEHGTPGLSGHNQNGLRYFASSIRDGAAERWLANGKGWPKQESKEETAEERVRAFLAMHDDDTTLMDIGPGARSSLEAADLRAILAELDRVRETSEALRASLRASNAVAQHVQGERDGLAESLDEHTRQIERLRAQRPVDVEAALAPVRDALCLISDHRASVKRSLDTAYKNGCGAQGSDYRLLGYAYDLAAVHVTDALAEAEKIGRGQ